MSLSEFQRAFGDLIASPQLVLHVRRDPSAALSLYVLSDRELKRLSAMCADEAMSINCTLYRVNRLVPIYSVLPRTCMMLGARLENELTEYWRSERDSTLQFHRQSVRFAEWLRARRSAGTLQGGPWEDALRFELTVFEVRTAPSEPGAGTVESERRRRTVVFHYDPEWVINGEPSSEAPLLDVPIAIIIDAMLAGE